MNHPAIVNKQNNEAQLKQLREIEGEGKVKLGVNFRELKFNRDHIDEEARTVELSFSSEEPYSRWFGEEILGHEATEVRLGRLHDGAPLLFNHDRDAHLGIIEEAKLENKRGVAVVRFGNSELANEKFNDVKATMKEKFDTVSAKVKELEKELYEKIESIRKETTEAEANVNSI